MDLIEANSTPDYALQCIKWCIEHSDLAALTEHLRHHNSKVKHEIIPLLFEAFSNQQVEVVKIMLPSLDQEILTLSSLNRGALLNKLLCSAVETGDVDIVKDLINKGADLDCNFHGKPLLHIAACYGYTDIVTVLVDAGSKIDSRDRFGDGIIHSILTSQSLSKVNTRFNEEDNYKFLL
jgi:ankyrin repeat protein